MEIMRRQWPVGQGNFSSGLVVTSNDRYVYVYDCGSDNAVERDQAVTRFVDCNNKIDALFISHLDSDHVDGFDRLLAQMGITEVYLPYLSPSDVILSLAREVEAGSVSGNAIGLYTDPGAWFGARGVERVIFVRPGGSDPDPLRLPEGDIPPPLDDGGHIAFKPTRSLVVKRVGRGRRASEFLMDSGVWLQGHVDGRAVDWGLVPFVHPESPKAVKAMVAGIKSALGITSGGLTVGAIVEGLKDAAKRRAIRGAYHAIRADHNLVSMSLYSGPVSGSASRWKLRCHHGPYWTQGGFRTVGWMGTGDANLSRRNRRGAWRKYYARFMSSVVTLVAPHHGSEHNFHPDVIGASVNFCIAAAGEPNRHGHPDDVVRRSAEYSGCSFVHVSQHSGTTFDEHIAPDP